MRNVVYDAAKTTIYGPPGAPEDLNTQANAATRHPIAYLFHLLFKCSAFALYFFGSLFGMNTTMMYVSTILLLAFDFWTVKVHNPNIVSAAFLLSLFLLFVFTFSCCTPSSCFSFSCLP